MTSVTTFSITLPTCPACGSYDLYHGGTHGVQTTIRYYVCRGCGAKLRGIIANPPPADFPFTGNVKPRTSLKSSQ